MRPFEPCLESQWVMAVVNRIGWRESTYSLRVSFVDRAALETVGAIDLPEVTLADWVA